MGAAMAGLVGAIIGAGIGAAAVVWSQRHGSRLTRRSGMRVYLGELQALRSSLRESMQAKRPISSSEFDSLTYWRQNPESFGLLPFDVWRGTVMPVHSFHMAMQDVYLSAREPWMQQTDRVYEHAIALLDHMIEPLQRFAR